MYLRLVGLLLRRLPEAAVDVNAGLGPAAAGGG